MPSNHLILCRPLLLPPSIFPSIRVFSSESALCIRWPEYWSFSFSISPSNEYSGLISFKIDWFDLLVVQLTVWVICIDGNDLLNDTIPYSDASINLYGKKSSCGFFKFNPELPMKIHDFVPVFQSQILNNLSSHPNNRKA